MSANFRLKLPPLWRNPDASADQYRFIKSPKRFSLAATGTKTGKTMGGAIGIIEYASQLPPNSLCWWVGPFWRTTEIGMNRVKQLIPEGRRQVNESKMVIRLTNGVTIEFRSADKPDTLFGEAIHYVFVDEGPRMRDDAWNAILTTTTQTKAPIRIAGNTDRGKNNWFYRLYKQGLNGDPDVDSWSMKTYENPHLTKEQVDFIGSKLSRRMREILIEAVFPDNGTGVFFGLDECLFEPFQQSMPIISRPNPDHAYLMGLDLAKFTDFTVITIFDINTRQIVYWNRFNKRSWEQQLGTVMEAQKLYQARICMDSTGLGEPFYERLMNAGANVIPFKFTNVSKQQLIEKLALGVEKRDILIPNHLGVLVEEMNAFEVDISDKGVITFTSPGETTGIHDDTVISLALAYWGATSNVFEVGYVSAEPREMPLVTATSTEELIRVAPSSRWSTERGRGIKWEGF